MSLISQKALDSVREITSPMKIVDNLIIGVKNLVSRRRKTENDNGDS